MLISPTRKAVCCCWICNCSGMPSWPRLVGILFAERVSVQFNRPSRALPPESVPNVNLRFPHFCLLYYYSTSNGCEPSSFLYLAHHSFSSTFAAGIARRKWRTGSRRLRDNQHHRYGVPDFLWRTHLPLLFDRYTFDSQTVPGSAKHCGRVYIVCGGNGLCGEHVRVFLVFSNL